MATPGVTHYCADDTPRGHKYSLTTYSVEALNRLGLLVETPLFKENWKTLEDEAKELIEDSEDYDGAMEQTFLQFGMSMTFKDWKNLQYLTGMTNAKILEGFHDKQADTFRYYFTEYKHDGHPDGLKRATEQRLERFNKKKELEAKVDAIKWPSDVIVMSLKQENDKLKADIIRLTKERNFLGNYEGGATSDEDSTSDEEL